MTESKKVAVTIPIFKPKPDESEITSLIKCLNILGRHPIVFFCPHGLDVTFYINLCSKDAHITFETFPIGFFADEQKYNRLLLSASFYKRFKNYKYILMYRLSSFVFKDELEYWCSQGYDYMGAPVIAPDLKSKVVVKKSFFRSVFRNEYRHIRGGGFSLRNVSKCYLILSVFNTKIFGYSTEDAFWEHIGNLFFFYFKLPKETEATRFSYEGDPGQLQEVLRSEPFGCSSNSKFGVNFWNNYIFANSSIK